MVLFQLYIYFNDQIYKYRRLHGFVLAVHMLNCLDGVHIGTYLYRLPGVPPQLSK